MSAALRQPDTEHPAHLRGVLGVEGQALALRVRVTPCPCSLRALRVHCTR